MDETASRSFGVGVEVMYVEVWDRESPFVLLSLLTDAVYTKLFIRTSWLFCSSYGLVH